MLLARFGSLQHLMFIEKCDFNSRSLDIGHNIRYFKYPGKLHRKSALITPDFKTWNLVILEGPEIRLHY
jgi:hypothetical protein